MFVATANMESPAVRVNGYYSLATGSSSFSTTMDCGDHANRYLVIGLTYRSSLTYGAAPSTITAGGVSLTLLGDANYNPNADGIALYGGVVNTSGTITIAGTFALSATTCVVIAYSLYGLNSTTAVETDFVVVTNSVTPLTVTASGNANDIGLFFALGVNTAVLTALLDGTAITTYGATKDVAITNNTSAWSWKIINSFSGTLSFAFNNAYVAYGVWARFR